MTRYYVLGGFLLFATLLFLIGRIIGSQLININKYGAIDEQFSETIKGAMSFLIFYGLALLTISLLGFLYWRRKKEREMKMGFVYSLILSIIIAVLILYLVISYMTS
jgi:heme/copper-type cytochrome/quinol oxidase subunit 4